MSLAIWSPRCWVRMTSGVMFDMEEEAPTVVLQVEQARRASMHLIHTRARQIEPVLLHPQTVWLDANRVESVGRPD